MEVIPTVIGSTVGFSIIGLLLIKQTKSDMPRHHMAWGMMLVIAPAVITLTVPRDVVMLVMGIVDMAGLLAWSFNTGRTQPRHGNTFLLAVALANIVVCDVYAHTSYVRQQKNIRDKSGLVEGQIVTVSPIVAEFTQTDTATPFQIGSTRAVITVRSADGKVVDLPLNTISAIPGQKIRGGDRLRVHHLSPGQWQVSLAPGR